MPGPQIALTAVVLVLSQASAPQPASDRQPGFTIPIVDLTDESSRQTIVDREPKQYLGHPTTLLLEDGKTILAVFPKGHGQGAIVYKRSMDGGKTWSERLPTPETWTTSLETPTLHRVIDAGGKKRIILFSGRYPVRMAVSEDDGENWSGLKPVGDWGGLVTMASVLPLKSAPGRYLALFHDDGRYFAAGGRASGIFTLYQSLSQDGGLTWAKPVPIQTSSEVHLCEPGAIRSPDGKQIALLLRENRRLKNSHIIFSDDEGETWTRPRELPGSLTGDRHVARYAPDGRLLISFRDVPPQGKSTPNAGDWVGWVGTYDDIVHSGDGAYRIRFKKNHNRFDCAYPGVELLPDGTFVVTTYGHWIANESPYILSMRFMLAELDAIAAKSPKTAAIDFEKEVSPIFVTRCLECHSAANVSGGLLLSTGESIRRGGDSGEVLTPGNPDASPLFERVSHGEMPPPKNGRKQSIPNAEQQTLRRWIAAGAPWPAGRRLDLYERTTAVRGGRDWWSLQPIVRPEIPAPRRGSAESNPIDAFVQARLSEQGLSPAREADHRTLIRRLSFDLLGLPPTAAETEAFVRDDSPQAYERLVDRMLDSPHFGERWARHWLDLVRFAETSGYERDQEKPGAWKYRDWVVQSINADKPYDRFVIEQLAGDELPDRTTDTVIATGLLRLGTWNDEPNDPEEYKYERLEDLVQVTSTAFLGVTVKCARCHDHKFDPIPQADYYRLAAAFWPGPIEPRARELLGGPTRDELGDEVLGWTDVTRDPAPLHLLHKGELKHPGPAVEAGVLSMIPGLERAFVPSPAEARTTTRRLQFARWVVDRSNPLTARVFVNRLWQHHFGQALVRTPDNFGFTGQQPTHPELLDWLADDFMRGDWKAKRVHRLLVTSKTYRQASVHSQQAAYAAHDPDNRLWWRAERRRHDVEALRDAILAVSGQIDLRVGGPSFKPTISAEALEGLSRKSAAWTASPTEEQRRRSLYIYSQRSLLAPLLTTFDFCDTTQPCGQRDVSTVAPQALALLNGAFAHEQSQALARRVVTEAGAEPAARVQTAWRLALGRAPRPEELTLALEHIAQIQKTAPADTVDFGLASLCHVLLNSNEFIYVD
jgi:Protein of unknown function (DUF1553)/Protein of unknown function (DUF1549)/Planctomycete cytochrome C/BNR repeat-like domain